MVVPNTTKVQVVRFFRCEETEEEWVEILPVVAWAVDEIVEDEYAALPVTLETCSRNAREALLLEDGRVVFPEEATYGNIAIAKEAAWKKK